MRSFKSDYMEGAHPKVLEALINTDYEQSNGYGYDVYCDKAAGIIKKLCNNENIGVHLLVGGTQTNLCLIAAALRPHQGVISPATGHIQVHEAGAIEAAGHRVITVETSDGKIKPEQISSLCDEHKSGRNREHTVQPKLVYISNSTEIGSIYNKKELLELRRICDENGLYLYMDGARLAYALTSDENDLTLADIAALCDAFYIGGTKAGLLFGEALVISNNIINQDFRYIMKQRGAMLAKGRLLGVQFEALLSNGLYFEIGKRANAMAKRIKNACIENNIPFLIDSPTNQQFLVVPNNTAEKLKDICEIWKKTDENHTAVRLCISWAADEKAVDEFIGILKDVSA